MIDRPTPLANQVVPLLRGPGPSRRPTLVDLHWAAGFLEGEGSFAGNGRYVKRPNGISHKVAAYQSGDPETLDRLRALFGGVVGLMPTPPGYKQRYGWQVSGVRARGVMMTLYCLLSKRRQAYIREELARGRWKPGPPPKIRS